jgi:hypothetical protein
VDKNKIMKISILIPSIYEREAKLSWLKNLLREQIHSNVLDGEVEIVTFTDVKGNHSTGLKRNKLIEDCNGEYVFFFDDDDEPSDDYISEIYKACLTGVDVIPINGFMTTNGKNPVYWEMGLGFPYDSTKINGETIYRRFPNHIAGMKRELILPYKFKDISYGEDYEWAKRINDDKVFKTEYRILKPIYHYVFTK